jgi:Ser/Thr protein kinase RdoA (MazF antagonist)
MKTAVYQEALDAFANPFHEFSIEELPSGTTNQSYKVTSRLNGRSFLLQQINQKVFSEPAHVQDNYEMLWKYLHSEEIPFVIPEPKYFPDDSTLYVDSHDNYWRVFEYIPGGHVIDKVETPAQARMVAQTVGSFTASFEGFDHTTLHITIPGFHNLTARVRQFHQAIHSGHYERLHKAAPVADELKQRERYASFYDVLTESDEFRERVTHHDATVSNIIFDAGTQNVVCLVDLDTVMQGYFFSDLGEMIRTMSCCKNENSIAVKELEIRKEYYEAIVTGYLSVMEPILTASEKKYIHFAGLMIIYMQALRFITDYLEGDIHHKTDYREQNLDRARNQLLLLKKLEAFVLEHYKFKI